MLYKLSQQKFEVGSAPPCWGTKADLFPPQSPNSQSQDEMTKKFDALTNEISETFRQLLE